MPKRLPKGWIRTTLGEICDINPRRSLDVLADDMDVSFVPMASVEEETGRIDASQIRALREVRRGYTAFKENDVIFAKITPCMENGKIALATGLKNGVGLGSTEFIVFRPFDGVLPRFILYFLLQPQFRRAAQRQMTGVVGQKRVPTGWLAKQPFALPPTKEQERIVSKLDRLLARIEAGEVALARARERLSRYVPAVLEAAVTGELTRRWREENDSAESAEQLLASMLKKREQRCQQAELDRFYLRGKKPKNDAWKSRYHEAAQPDVSALPKLPKGWVWSSISQLSWNCGYGTSIKCTLEAAGPAVLRIPNIQNRRIELANLKYATDKKALSDDHFVTTGDFLIVRTNGSKDLIGRGAVITKKLRERCSFASYLIRYRLLGAPVTWHWISLAWDSPVLRSKIESKALTTAGQYNISLSRLADTAVPLPPLTEQRETVAAVERRLKAAERLDTKLNKSDVQAKQQRESLLLDAFTGRVVPQHSDDEPALLLLQRVRILRDELASKQRTNVLRRKQIQPQRSTAALLDLINQRFGNAAFTFEDLQKEIHATDYEKTKSELFELAQPSQPDGKRSPLRMSFNAISGLIEFIYQAK